MSDLYCPVCKELNLGFFAHTCKPVFECTGYDPREGGGFEFEFRAGSAQSAAEMYAIQQASSGDWPSEDNVYVREKGKRRVEVFAVRVELEPTAYGREEGSPFDLEECELCGKCGDMSQMVLHDELGLHCLDCQVKHGTLPEPQAELEG